MTWRFDRFRGAPAGGQERLTAPRPFRATAGQGPDSAQARPTARLRTVRIYEPLALPPDPSFSLEGRIPSLDGLRALSILLVFIAHARTTTGVDFSLRRWTTAIPGNGALGVSIFFVISGFLITHLLVRERDREGSIGLGGFYARRAFRILPPFYAFLGVLTLLKAFGWMSITWEGLAAAALFVTNYAPISTPEWVGHTWSLSIEEQFYLFWPAMLAGLIALAPRWRRGAAWMALGLIVAVPILRLVLWKILPPGHLLVRRTPLLLHTRADTLMFGCLAALLYARPAFQAALSILWKTRLHWLAFAYLFLAAPYLATWKGTSYFVYGGYTIEGLFIMLLVVWAVQHPKTGVGRVLNWGPVVHIGLISYSLYLWQQLFLIERNHTWFGKPPQNLLLALAAAEASWWLIERPSHAIRDRLLGRRHYQQHHGSDHPFR